MKIGDTIFHRPTEEYWVVAKILENGDIIATGWPCTYGKAENIELNEVANDHDHKAMIARLKELPASDPRHIPKENS